MKIVIAALESGITGFRRLGNEEWAKYEDERRWMIKKHARVESSEAAAEGSGEDAGAAEQVQESNEVDGEGKSKQQKHWKKQKTDGAPGPSK
ncbi:hypothetical protein EVJ58_g7736 [Rhodofomes roseus]|uniref:Uncharacterized protein n=1 Tax=Rhodofomes roseus TaxID=34475 RepID=A0A4Y9Y1E2_9APHY|nr:hypothetical protein EVJ58_g7736 [Rhodofomes roseus]